MHRRLELGDYSISAGISSGDSNQRLPAMCRWLRPTKQQIQELGSDVWETMESGRTQEAGEEGPMGAVEESRCSQIPRGNSTAF